MKVRLPLSVKFTLWLGLNLVLLVLVVGAVLLSSGGLAGWLQQPVGDRLANVANAIAREINSNAPRLDRDAVIERYAAEYGLTFMVYENRGDRVAGATLEVPAEVRFQMRGSPNGVNRQPPPRVGERPPPRREDGVAEGRRPPRPEDALDDDVSRPPRARDDDEAAGPERVIDPRPRQDNPPRRAGGRIFEYDAASGRWWMGVRIPVVHLRTGDIVPGVLLAASDSPWAFGALLDLRPMFWAVAVALVVSVLFWLPIVVGMTRALRRLMHTTERIAEGRFDTRGVPTRRSDEIGRLAESIERMAVRLEALVNGQKKFLADVAHELGSPVGRLQVGASILEERVPEPLRGAVNDVREDVEHMGRLVGELLDFTRAGLKPAQLGADCAALADVVRRVVAREGGGRDHRVTVPDDLVVVGEAALLERVIGNVVRNAWRYAGETAEVSVVAEETSDGWVRVSITDNGPGVPPDALARLGEPFFRPDTARTAATGGTGLGLSIVREVVSALGGAVRFANRTHRGFVVELTLPTKS